MKKIVKLQCENSELRCNVFCYLTLANHDDDANPDDNNDDDNQLPRKTNYQKHNNNIINNTIGLGNNDGEK